MCTTWSTRNRANVYNLYTVQTLLVNKDCYCPEGPNHPDYTYRSRLYNPDPKYQGHLDHTCHMYDSIPKDKCCSGYGKPNFHPCFNFGNKLPCFADSRGCWPPKEFSDCWCPMPPLRCKRREIRPPTNACCKPKTTMKQWICFVKQCKKQQQEMLKANNQVQEESNAPLVPLVMVETEECDEEAQQIQETEGGYSLQVPRAKNYSGSKVTYNYGRSGNCYLRTEDGKKETTKMECDGCIMVETDGCGGMSTKCMGGKGLNCPEDECGAIP